MKAEHIAAVKTFLVEGNKGNDIKEYLLDNGVKPGEVAGLISAAWDSIVSDSSQEPEEIKAWCDGALLEIYRRTLQTGDYAGAKSAVKERIALHDLKGTRKAASKPSSKKDSKVDNVTWPNFKTLTSPRK